jgi:hypothetical protein
LASIRNEARRLRREAYYRPGFHPKDNENRIPHPWGTHQIESSHEIKVLANSATHGIFGEINRPEFFSTAVM